MTFGLGVFKAGGALAYSSDDVTWNQVDMLFCPRGGSVQGTYGVLAGREVLTAQMLINPPPLDRKALAHTISVNGTTITASGGSEDAYILVLMR